LVLKTHYFIDLNFTSDKVDSGVDTSDTFLQQPETDETSIEDDTIMESSVIFHVSSTDSRRSCLDNSLPKPQVLIQYANSGGLWGV